eukprot:CAMPEP_0206401382 /NCGR_PEP_ID=MMETSP0294-20121207/26229_1 /ASSEMBLY_ACC=CAM_ASM_000327 /TAXON_ID=39354 /ORGANISM="Heterosigma akashiwo, Strain CCMP2393" /LENGTH=132 /DNA_ID=CAMNT_0053858057 /DNA_START=265 /DNA_END=660 /DNA_ORIENTATION=-
MEGVSPDCSVWPTVPSRAPEAMGGGLPSSNMGGGGKAFGSGDIWKDDQAYRSPAPAGGGVVPAVGVLFCFLADFGGLCLALDCGVRALARLSVEGVWGGFGDPCLPLTFPLSAALTFLFVCFFAAFFCCWGC